MGKKYNRNSTSPEPVQSNGINTTIGVAAVSFNERDYQILHARYLQPRIRTNAVLAGGMTLRRQTKSRIIDNHHKGLAAKIDSLDKKGRREEIYAMLVSLKEWDLDPKKVPHFMRSLPNSGRRKGNKINEGEDDEDSVDDGAVYEFVDLSKEEVVTRYIDLDHKEDGSNSCDEFEWDEHTAFPEYVRSRDVLNSATKSVHENNAEHQECIPRGEDVLTASTTCDEIFFQVAHAACRELWLFASKIEMYLSNRMFYKKKGSPCSLGKRRALVGGINRSSCSSSSAMSEKSLGSSKHVATKEVNAKEQFMNSSDLQNDGDECLRVAQNQVILKSSCSSRSIEYQQKPGVRQSTPFSSIISKDSGNPGIVDLSNEENYAADEMSRNKCQSSSYFFHKVEVDPVAVVAIAKNSLPTVCETITNNAISGTICKPDRTIFSEGPNLPNSVAMSISESLPKELSKLVAKTRTNPSQNTLISMNNIAPLDNTLIDLTSHHSESCKSNDESTGNSFGDCTSVQIQEAVDGMMTFHESFDQARYPASTPMNGTHMNEGYCIHNMDRTPALAMYDKNYAITKLLDKRSVDYEGNKSEEKEYGNDDFVDCKCDNVIKSDENLNKGLALSSTVYAAEINSERLFDSMHTPLPSIGIVSVGFKACHEKVQKTEETRRMQPTNLNERFQIASFISRSTVSSPTVVTPNEHEISYSTSYENFPEDGNGIENEGELSEHLQPTMGLKSVAKHMQRMCLINQPKGSGQGKSEEYTPSDRPEIKKNEPNILPTKKITSYFGVARRNPIQMPSHDIEVSSISIASQRLNTQNTTDATSATAQNRQQMAKTVEASKNRKWLIRYKQLKEYRDKYGHCSVPVAWSCNPTLGTWVSAQRYQYKLNHDGKKSCLTRERINLLNQLGFVWRAKSGRREDRIPLNESNRTQKDMSNKNDEAQSTNKKCAHRYNILSTERIEVKRNPPNRSLTIQNIIMEDHSIAPSVPLVQSGYSHSSSKEKGRNSLFVPIIGDMGPTLEGLPKTPFQTPQYDTCCNSPKEYSNNISKVNPFSPTSSETSNIRNQELTVFNPLKHIRQQVMKCNTETTQFSKVCQVDRTSNALNQRDPIPIQANSSTQSSDFLQNIKGSNGEVQIDPDLDITLELKSPDCGKILKQDTSLVPPDGYLSEATRVRCERNISNPTIVKPKTKKRDKRRSHKRTKLRLQVIDFGFPTTVNHSKKMSRNLEVMCTERPTRPLIPQVPVVLSKAKIKPPSQRFQFTRIKTNLAQFPAIGCLTHQLSRVDTTKNFPIVPPYRTNKRSAQSCLANEWRKQSKKRRKGEWLPSGGWRPPHWAPPLQDKRGLYLTNHENKEEKRSVALKQFGCRKTLLPRLERLMNSFTALLLKERINITVGNRPDGDDRPKNLSEVKYPEYLNPTVQVLKTAHLMIQDLLPKGDCECFEVIKIARSYYDYWRPAHGKTKVIVLAESHAFTERHRATKGPGLESSLLQDTYFGPREFISLVYCLAYGENEALSRECNDPNKGTPQFWALLAACSRGADFVPDMAINAKTRNVRAQFATDVLKGGGLPVKDRLEAKVKILKDLQTRGIWLLDASLFGWYISQPQEYNRSVRTNEIHRKAKARPPKDLKAPSLVLSWELFTKHVIRDIANEGGLKLLIPIGMEVEASLTRGRLEDAISTEPEASVAETFPAPNAWIPGGYGPFHVKLAALIHEVAPRILEGEK